MAKGAETPWLTVVLLVNSALLATIALALQLHPAYQPGVGVPTIATGLKRQLVAGAKTVKLTNETLELAGSGRVLAAGRLTLAGTGSFALVSNGEIAMVNGKLINQGQVIEPAEPIAFEIWGDEIFVELSGQPFSVKISGTGSLVPDIEATTEVAN